MNSTIKKPRGSARKKWLIRFGFLAACVAVIFYFSASHFRTVPPALMTYSVRKGDIESTVLATGVLKPAHLVAVGAQASGRVLSLKFAVGQKVKKDDLIAEIDSTTQKNDLRKAQAELVRNQANRAEKVARLQLAQQDMTRQDRMISQNAISRADYDKAVSAVKSAEAQIALSDAEIVVAKIAAETAEANLGYTQIRAPIDGTLLATVVREGQTVNAVQSAPTIAIIGQLETMTVEADISEADIINVKEGQDLYFTIPGQSKKRYTAKLETVEPAPQTIVSDKSFGNGNSTGGSGTSTSSAIYYKGIFNIDNADGFLKTYMTAEIHIVLGSAKDKLIIPSAALSPSANPGKEMVRVVAKDGSISQREVATGLNDKIFVEIQSGLTEGEAVATGDNSMPASGASGPDGAKGA
ncbi:efflux RND transporter periplasmic adaptor subunit (plasmid) [Phyllobacterium sp. 628]|uniref:efflux RND transporter periplasmic adaptor subunit n=1 Tax=Phyllobacterium sp. 628 TaxID=2718938 RepID=UPI0016622526|nr:efflux RND transporter periplasmic adaptor subunit [Phyllobacterium sp. 628]QND54452.1 efflux RND transporter periplasmic adaptor subunit [Phyllobacterium sp. 628]